MSVMSDQEQMKKVMSYLIGHRLGSQMLPQMLPGLAADDLVGDALAKGVQDALGNDMDMSLINENIERYQQEFISMLQGRAAKKGEENLELGRKYMEENGIEDISEFKRVD